jgi:hypothetical protein
MRCHDGVYAAVGTRRSRRPHARLYHTHHDADAVGPSPERRTDAAKWHRAPFLCPSGDGPTASALERVGEREGCRADFGLIIRHIFWSMRGGGNWGVGIGGRGSASGWEETHGGASNRGPTGQACRQHWPDMKPRACDRGRWELARRGPARRHMMEQTRRPRVACPPSALLDPTTIHLGPTLPPASRWGFTACSPTMCLCPPHHVPPQM